MPLLTAGWPAVQTQESLGAIAIQSITLGETARSVWDFVLCVLICVAFLSFFQNENYQLGLGRDMTLHSNSGVAKQKQKSSGTKPKHQRTRSLHNRYTTVIQISLCSQHEP